MRLLGSEVELSKVLEDGEAENIFIFGEKVDVYTEGLKTSPTLGPEDNP